MRTPTHAHLLVGCVFPPISPPAPTTLVVCGEINALATLTQAVKPFPEEARTVSSLTVDARSLVSVSSCHTLGGGGGKKTTTTTTTFHPP